jgi:carboxyl-terminal processing protease
MKLTRFILFASCLAVSLNSCQTIDNILHPSDAKNEYVDSWILTNMSSYYYWNNMLPDKTDKTLTPDKYFKSILYKYDPVTAPDGDRFSWIESDYTKLMSSLNGVVPNEIGFDISLYYKDATRTDVIGQVNYVKKGTPAETSGVKRGMFFDRVNGTVMTKSNYSSLLTITAADVTIGFVAPVYNTNGYLTGYTSTTEKTLQTVSKYSENPVYLDTIIIRNNHKVGYFVYHFFAPDDGHSTSTYDLDMNAAFGRFKAAGITDLIIDLRYNSGGHTTSSQLLASEIVPDVSNTKLFTYYRYNLDYNAAYIKYYGAESLKTYFTTNVLRNDTVIGTVNNVGNQLGGKVYVLTGQFTASASEQVINGLYPYMDVVLVGDTTYGKNVASVTIWDKVNPKKNKWGMQPIVAKYFNSLGKSDFTAGFAPDFVLKEGGAYMKEFGDPSEPLLNAALNDIVGNQILPIVQKRAGSIQADKLLSLPNKRIRGAQLDNLPFFE